MTSGPCLRRCRVVRRYMPRNIKCYRLHVKLSSSIHVSMDFEPFPGINAANTGFPCPKVPIRRKLRSEVPKAHPANQLGCNAFHIDHGLIRGHIEIEVLLVDTPEGTQIGAMSQILRKGS